MAISSVTARQVCPNSGLSMFVVTYSKAGATDYCTMDVVTNELAFSPMKTVRFACASDDTAGASDVVTYATSVVTFVGTGSLTGAGRLLVIGNC